MRVLGINQKNHMTLEHCYLTHSLVSEGRNSSSFRFGSSFLLSASVATTVLQGQNKFQFYWSGMSQFKVHRRTTNRPPISLCKSNFYTNKTPILIKVTHTVRYFNSKYRHVRHLYFLRILISQLRFLKSFFNPIF